MTPRRRHDDLDFILAHRGRKKKRSGRIRRRRRAGIIAGTFVVAIAIIVLTVGLGAGTALSASCNLNTLRPVEIGQNSFVYAADGSVLGSIPAERNREPVSNAQMSRWLPKATIAIEDRRFYEHGGVDYVGIARSTSSRRSSAACGLWYGSYTDGACGSPASSAACSSESWLACFAKYVCAAASTP